MIKTLFIIVWTILVTIYYGTMAIILSYLGSSRIVHRVAQLWAGSILLASGIRVKVRGLALADPDRSYIFMSNHQSNFDIPVLLAHLPVEFKWLAKAELFRIPIFGQAMTRAGYISIDRSNRKSAFASLKRAAGDIRNGKSVMIFPEGTRSPDGNVKPFKKGGFVLAVDSGVPVIPVVIHGTGSIMPKRQLTITPGNVTVRFGKPIRTSEYTRKTKDALLDDVRRVICAQNDRFRKGVA